MLDSLNLWYVWPVGILLWGLLGWAEFGVLERRGLASKAGDSTHPTLSYFVFYLTSKFPLSIAIGCVAFGMFWGGLFVHFWWHWCPPGSVSAG